MHVVLTGGTGFIGRALITYLLRAGHRVSVLTRNPATASGNLPAGVRPLAWDDPWPEPGDAVIHLAGATLAHWPWSQGRKQTLWNSRVAVTRKLMEKIAAQNPRPAVLVSASGMGFYGDAGDREVRAGDPPGADFLGRLAAAWEKEACAARELGLRVVMLRQGMVLHPGGGALAAMTRPFRLGLGAVFGSGRQFWPWIHRDDAVELYARALTDSRYDGPLHAVAGEPLTQKEFARALASAFRRPLLLRVPEKALRLVLGEMADLLLHGQRAVGDAPQFPARYPTLRAALTAA